MSRKASETSPLIEEGLSPTLKSISSFIDSESRETVDTSQPVIPESAKSYLRQLLMFSNAGYLVELVVFSLLVFLGVEYTVSGCLVVGVSMLGVACTMAWLCLPTLIRPLFSNAIIRWFLVTSHTSHVTGLISILVAIVLLSYLSWTNDCRSRVKAIQTVTTTVLSFVSLAIFLFLIACYRDENGNGGYIKWLFRLLF